MDILGLEKVSFVDYEGLVCATIFTGGCNFMCPFCHNSSLVFNKQDIISEQEVLSYLEQRKKLLDAVTISGGEPTLQKGLKEFIVKVKALGYKVKLDTNGTFPNIVKDLIESNLIDYVAMDIKTSFYNYPLLTGIKHNFSNNVKQTLAILKNSNVDYELRTTLVKDFHDKESIEQMARDLDGENLLYLQKFVDSGDCINANLNAVSKQQAQEFKDILQKHIKNVNLRGYS